MKHYVIEIATGDSKIAGKSIYEHEADTPEESKKMAVASYHSKMGSAMKSDLFTSEMVMVIDEFGGVVISDYYRTNEVE